MSENPKHPTAIDWLFRVLGLLAIAYLGLLIFDLFALAREPFNPSIAPFPIRIVVGALAGASGILISTLILWRVPGNPVGRFLLLWTIGVMGFQFSYNFGSDRLDQTAFFVFAFYFGAIALTSLVLLLFYFPTGAVYPKSFKWFVPLFIVVRVAGTALAVASTNPTAYKHAENPFLILGLEEYSEFLASTVGINGGISFVIGLLLGTYSLITRYRQADIVQQQQIKWFAWAGAIITAAVSVFVGVHLLIYPGFTQLVPLIDFPFFVLVAALPPLAVGAAVLRYRLWDVNFLISRTVIYVTLTAILAAVFAASAGIINQFASGLFRTETGAPAALVSTILIVAIFQPVRKEVEGWINERYFPENRELSRDFLEFSGEFRSVMTESEMLGLIARRMCGLMNSRWVCIFLRSEGDGYSASGGWNIELEKVPGQLFPAEMLTPWGAARAVRNSENENFPVLAPLYVSRVRDDHVVGILGLGPRERGQGYSRNDLRGLTRFGQDAGRVLYSYQFRAEKQSE